MDRSFCSDRAGESVPTYYFNVNGGSYHCTDLVGRNCRDVGAAHREAHRIAAEMITASLIAGRVPDDATIEVEDEDMRPVLEMKLTHAAS